MSTVKTARAPHDIGTMRMMVRAPACSPDSKAARYHEGFTYKFRVLLEFPNNVCELDVVRLLGALAVSDE